MVMIELVSEAKRVATLHRLCRAEILLDDWELRKLKRILRKPTTGLLTDIKVQDPSSCNAPTVIKMHGTWTLAEGKNGGDAV